MAITSTTAVGTEYEQRRDQIRAYDDTELNTDLANIEALALRVDEALELYQAREILKGHSAPTDPASAPIFGAARSIRDAVSAVRAAVAVVKAQIPD